MNWIRINRYFWEDADGHDPTVHFVPMMCQQCAHAPCESRLPGPRHLPQHRRPQRDGLQPLRGHALLRERLPVRRSRSLQLPQLRRGPSRFNLQLNPDVMVAHHGRHGEVHVLRAAHPPGEGRLPRPGLHHDGARRGAAGASGVRRRLPHAGAMTFGNLKDPASVPAKTRQSGRNYIILSEFNTRSRPSTTSPRPSFHVAEARSRRRPWRRPRRGSWRCARQDRCGMAMITAARPTTTARPTITAMTSSTPMAMETTTTKLSTTEAAYPWKRSVLPDLRRGEPDYHPGPAEAQRPVPPRSRHCRACPTWVCSRSVWYQRDLVGHGTRGHDQRLDVGRLHRQLRLLDRHRPRRHADLGHPLPGAVQVAHRRLPRVRGHDGLRGHDRLPVPGAAPRPPAGRCTGSSPTRTSASCG